MVKLIAFRCEDTADDLCCAALSGCILPPAPLLMFRLGVVVGGPRPCEGWCWDRDSVGGGVGGSDAVIIES